MEKDDEVKGKGNSYDFGARMHDPRIGRWLSLDAFASKYVELSPYNFVANSPLMFIDPDGNKIICPTKEDQELFNQFENLADRKTRKILRKLDKSDIIYEIRLSNQINMGLQVYLPGYENDTREKNGAMKLKSDKEGIVTFQLLIDKELGLSEQLSALAEEVSHAEDFEDGSLGYVSLGGYEGLPVYSDIQEEIKSKDVSLRYMKNASSKNSAISLTKINEEWSNLTNEADKINALMGGNLETFGDYSNLSKTRQHVDVMEIKDALDAFENQIGAKNLSFIYKNRGELQRVESQSKQDNKKI